MLSALPRRVTQPDPRTASSEHSNCSSSNFFWGRIWRVLEYKYQISSATFMGQMSFSTQDNQDTLWLQIMTWKKGFSQNMSLPPGFQNSAQLLPKIILQYNFQILASEDKQTKGHIQRFKKESGITDLSLARRNRTGKVLFPW